ncbi:MAG: hypothetical protein DCC68_13480 [Planctomycetota bacterium]|nr:MAG: hypothetical protein DCC68_13480 [Planctomycetota bacterium]
MSSKQTRFDVDARAASAALPRGAEARIGSPIESAIAPGLPRVSDIDFDARSGIRPHEVFVQPNAHGRVKHVAARHTDSQAVLPLDRKFACVKRRARRAALHAYSVRHPGTGATNCAAAMR